MKIPDATSCRGQGMEKSSRQFQHGIWQVKSKKEVVPEAQRDKKKVHFATLMDICHLKNAELEPKNYKNTKAESCSVVTL